MELRKITGNRKKEADGVEVNIADDFFVTVRRAGPTNRPYLEAFRREAARSQEAQRFNGKRPIEQSQEAAYRVYAETIVVAWRGCELDGKTIPFTPENFVMVMKEVPELFPAIEAEAQDVRNFQDAETEQAGNA